MKTNNITIVTIILVIVTFAQVLYFLNTESELKERNEICIYSYILQLFFFEITIVIYWYGLRVASGNGFLIHTFRH
jgi:hypothetical protein